MPDVKCQRCQRIYPAEQYVLDYRYKMVVCPQCAKEKDPKPKPAPEAQAEVIRSIPKPAANSEAKHAVTSEKIKVRCKKCKFEFKYDEKTKTPSRCPYCGVDVVF